MTVKKTLLSVVFACVLAICIVPAAFGATGNVTYQGKASGFIFSPGSAYSPTDLFTNFEGVMPGDSISQDIVIKNNAGNNINLKAYLRSLGAQNGSDDFLNQMTLTVTQKGGDTLFDAPAGQTAQLTDWTYLGTLAPNTTAELTVTLNVPITMGNDFQDQIGYLDWEFAVEEIQVVPKTGDTMGPIFIAIGVIAAIGVALVVVALVRRKKIQQSTM